MSKDNHWCRGVLEEVQQSKTTSSSSYIPSSNGSFQSNGGSGGVGGLGINSYSQSYTATGYSNNNNNNVTNTVTNNNNNIQVKKSHFFYFLFELFESLLSQLLTYSYFNSYSSQTNGTNQYPSNITPNDYYRQYCEYYSR